MSNIIIQNPIRYNIDNLNSIASGVLYSNSSSNVDLSGASSVSAINIPRTQPPGTAIFLAFRVNNLWGKITASGTFTAFTNQTLSYDNIATNGNSPESLEALSNIPALAGQRIGVAVALSSSDKTNAVPSCTVKFSCLSDSQKLTSTEYSPVYELGQDSQIISLKAETVTNSGGNVELLAKIISPDGTDSGWRALESLNGKKAQSVQFRADYRVPSLNTGSAQVSQAYAVYSDGSSIVSGLTDGEIISLTQDWYIPVKSCRLNVRHAPLVNASLKAAVCFRDKPILVQGEHLGVGSGARKTFELTKTRGIRYDTFRLFFDGSQIYSGFELNCEAGRVTCEAPEGVIVSCDYEYGWDKETWESMTLTQRISESDYDVSEFRLTHPDDNKSVCAIKLTLGMSSGKISGEVLGTAAGRAKTFKLSHRVLDGKISIPSNNAALASKNFTLLDDPQYISIAAPAGQTLRANYDWISETPCVYQFAAVFAE